MKKSVYRVSLDLHDTGAQFALNLKSDDTFRQLLTTLCERGVPYEITEDCAVKFAAKLPDGRVAVEPCEVSDSAILYDVSETVSSQSGKTTCEFVLTDDEGHVLTTPSFIMIISPSIVGGESDETI